MGGFLVFELPVLALNEEALSAFLDAADHLRVDVEALRDADDSLCILRSDIDLEAMAHVEDPIHLRPIGAAAVLNDLEQRRDGEHIILDDAAVFTDEMEDFRLCASRAMHHAVNLGPHLVEHLPDDRGVGTCGREDEFADVWQ